MKKRKSPILLVSLLVLLGAGAVAVSTMQGGGEDPHAHDVAEDTQVPLEKRDAPTAKSVADQIKSTSTAVAAPPKPGAPIAKDPTVRTVTVEKGVGGRFEKPVPSSHGQTNSQWYSNQ